ncbi:MAG: ATP-binding protein [Eubacteriaceae bacterium]|nr:ATP-binding protein [Eubacteriaceae bacterium]
MMDYRKYLDKEERGVLKKIPVMLTVYLAEKGRFYPVLVSDILCRFLNDTEENIIANFDEDRKRNVHPDDYRKLMNAETYAYLHPQEEYLLACRHKAGVSRKYKWLAGHGSSRTDEKGNLFFYVSYEYVTDEQLSVFAVSSSTDMTALLLEKILSTTQTAIFWKDAERRFLGANKAFLEYYDFASVKDIIGKTDEDMGWHKNPEPYKDDEVRIIRDGISTHRVPGNCISHGENRDIVASKSPLIVDGEIVGLVGSFEDVTEEVRQKRKIDALNKSVTAALKSEEQANKAINEFLSRTSHEIRTPMNAIIGLSELALESTEDETAISYFKKINSSGQYLLGIINDILDINKMEGGQIELHPKRMSLAELMENVNNIIAPLAEDKGVEYSAEYENIEYYYAVADQMRIQQIIINLLNNAVKFTETGGKVELKISQLTDRGSLYAKIEVRDNGCGMSESFMNKLFSPFAQENRDPSHFGTGTGLGLTISRKLARLMGGDITAESRENEGSVFTATFRLGICTQDEDAISRDAGILSKSYEEFLAGCRVLLAEDNQINREVAIGILSRKAVQIDIAEDGKEALDKFNASDEGYYDIILMDIQMPVMNGCDATRAIRALKRADAGSVPIIALTADVIAESVRAAIESGMNDVVAKPIDIDTLYIVMSRYLNTEA